MSGVKRNTEHQVFILNEKSSFVIQEAYKSLRTNLLSALGKKTNFSLGFTSPTAGEAKSTTAMNMALSFAQLGKRVILVDCNFRVPTIARKLGINGTPGLTDLIAGQCKFSEAAKRVQEYNIDVLPAGTLPEDPTLILHSMQMQTVIESLQKYYEVVIFDLPSANAVTDASMLGSLLDGYCLVVRRGYSDLKDVEEMLRQMQLAQANVLGFIYTDAPITKKKYITIRQQ